MEKMNYLAPHRPYDPADLEPARQMVANGATVSELAVYFDVPVASVELWAACHAEFAAALRIAKVEADDRVERSWYDRCVGRYVDSEKVQYAAGGVGVAGEWVRTPTREYLPPDVAACERWLRNRRPEQWNEKHELHLNGTIHHQRDEGPVLDLESCSPDEIQREYAEALAASASGKFLAPPAARDPGSV
jgi:hypothetical protein